MKSRSGTRSRICGTPVRTGCITCKIRRVKCGEEKPSCIRCTSTGRHCDGYMQMPSSNSSAETSLRGSVSPKPSEEPEEAQSLYFFQTFTAHKLSTHFSSNFWRQTVLQASTSEPSIRHGLIALGAVHQDFIRRYQTGEASIDSRMGLFAVKQYTRAISHLQKLMTTGVQQAISKSRFLNSGEHDPENFRRPLSELEACLRALLTECSAAAMMHLKAGLQILENGRTQETQGQSSASATEDELSQLLLGLGVQMASFASPEITEGRTLLWTALNQASPPTTITEFQSLDHARYALDVFSIAIHGSQSIEQGVSTFENSSLNKNSVPLCNWADSMERFIAGTINQEPLHAIPGSTRYGATLLQIHFLIISSADQLPPDSERLFDQILNLCRILIDSSSYQTLTADDLVFSADMGLIAPLYHTATTAPTLQMRRQAVELLAKIRGREGMWDSADTFQIAAMAIEAAANNAMTTAAQEEIWHT